MRLINPTRRSFLAGLPIVAAGAAFPGNPRAQTAGIEGPIRIIVPFLPGGSTDVVARLLAPLVQNDLGVRVVVENVPGPGSTTGSLEVQRAAPDGKTWLLSFDSHSLMAALYPRVGVDPVGGFTPVSLLATAPYVLATQPGKPYKNIKDFLAAGSKGGVTIGSAGNGTIGHLATVLLGERSKASLDHVAYRGGGLAVTEAAAGKIDAVVGSVALIAPAVQAGTLRPLLQFGGSKLAAFPDLPSVADLGMPDLLAVAWWGLFGPANLPPQMVARMQSALAAALKDPEAKRQMTEVQYATIANSGQAEFRDFLVSQTDLWTRVVREKGIKPD